MDSYHPNAEGHRIAAESLECAPKMLHLVYEHLIKKVEISSNCQGK